jgi:Protein of unknown function (DUF2892)
LPLLLPGMPASPLYHHDCWLWRAAAVGFNLLQGGFTQFCPAKLILSKLGVKKAGDQASALSCNLPGHANE